MAQEDPLSPEALLRDYKLKRARARHHLDELRRSIQDFRDINREAVRGIFDPEKEMYRFEVPLEDPDPAWALGLGDYAYNARASLDYLITALVRSAGNDENWRSEFPIHGTDPYRWRESEEDWEKDARKTIGRQLDGTPGTTKAALKRLQPFYGAPHRTNPMTHPLTTLKLLSNQDKHRRLNLLARNAQVEFTDPEGKPLYRVPTPDLPVAEANEGTYAVLLNARRNLGVDVFFKPAYDVRLNEPPELTGNLINRLEAIDRFIDVEVLPVIKGVLARRKD